MVSNHVVHFWHVLINFLAAISVTQEEEEAQASEVLMSHGFARVLALEGRDLNKVFCAVF